jgi:urea ABC transporter permease protein UrtB/urea ABC transporter permease protein UrtC
MCDARPNRCWPPATRGSRVVLLLLLTLGLCSTAHGQQDVGAFDLMADDDAIEKDATEEEIDEAELLVEDEVSARIRELLPLINDDDTGEPAVAEMLAMRDPRVKRVFERIDGRTLYLWEGRAVYVSQTARRDGQEVAPLLDPVTGQPLVVDGQPVLVEAAFLRPRENRLQGGRATRRGVRAGLAVIDLYAERDATRLTAARRVGDTRQADALPTLREMAANDPDWRVRIAAGESVAIIVMTGADPESTAEDRLAAAAALGALRSIRGESLIRAARDDAAADGASRETLAVYDGALSSIEWHKTRTRYLKDAFDGISLGSILLLVALGLAITFGLMGVINMAHGEMVMIGAVTTWACFYYVSPMLPAEWFNWYYVLALPAAFICAAIVGLLTEVLLIRHLYKRPLDSLLATIGVSFVLIQGVRHWRGDNLGMRRPTWFSGGWEIMQDVTLPWSRLFIIALTAACVLGVFALFRLTRIGLLVRATVQNREMAQCLGVNTRRVDIFTFALGAGIAGVAGCAIFLISNVTPQMGQLVIVDSFLVVVVGGVGNLLGVVFSGLGIGITQKFLEARVIITEPLRIFDATWAKVAVLLLVILFIQRRPGGLFPDKGRLADQPDKTAAPWQQPRSRWADVVLGAVLVFLGLVLVPVLYGMGYMQIGTVTKLGYFAAFAICAIGLDLIWGYMGVLSLCQFLFFALGGYAMGLYLINHGPMDRYGIPTALSYVMSDVGERRPPWFLSLFASFPAAVALGVLIPGALALLIGVTTFGSRVRGVYFAILTQAITVAAWLVFQKNDLKLGGTNGLTNFETILGYRIANNPAGGPFEQTRFWLYIASVVTLLLVLAIAKFLVHSPFGKVLVAIRDDETRLRFSGYKTWAYKAAAFTIAGVFAGIGGMLYAPQMGIVTPTQMAAFSSILVVIWVALGGRGTLWGAVIGAFAVNLLYDYMTTRAPNYWMFALGGLFVLVPLLLPGGLMSLPLVVRRSLGRLGRRSPAVSMPTQPTAAAARLTGGMSGGDA